jgi:predicted RND superfamily exporter protein
LDQTGIFGRLAKLIAKRPRTTLLVTLIVTAAGLYSALQLQPATGIRDMLADDQPAAIALGNLLDRFALGDDLIVLARTPEGEPADPDELIQFAERLSERLDEQPMVSRHGFRQSRDAIQYIEQVVIPNGLHYLDPSQRRAMLDRLSPEAMAEQFEQNAAMMAMPGPAAGQLAKELIQDPLRLREFMTERAAGSGGGGRSPFETMDGSDALISPDGRAIMIRVAGVESANSLPFTEAFMPVVRDAVQAANEQNLQIDYTGAYAIAELSSQATRSDMIRSCLGSIVLLVVLFLLVYRNPLTLPLLLLPVYVAIVLGFGIYAFVSGKLTPVTAVSGAVLAGLGIDYCVHYLAHYQAEHRDAPPSEASIRATRQVGPAIFAACVTTLIGFSTLMSCGVRSLREFSLLGLLGLLAALIASITVLPAMLLSVEKHGWLSHGWSSSRINLEPIVRGILRRAKSVGILAIVLGIACTVLLIIDSRDPEGGWRSPISFDHDLHAMHPRPHPPLETQKIVAEKYGAAPDSLTIYLEAETPDDLIVLAHRVQRRLLDANLEPLGLGGVTGPASLLPDPSQPPNYADFHIPTILADFEQAAIASPFNPAVFDPYQSFLRELLSPGQAPGWQQLRQYPTMANAVLPKDAVTPTDGIVLVTLTKPWETVEARNDMIVAVRDTLEGLDGVTLTGISVVGYDTQEAIGGELFRLTTLAGVAVLIWLFIAFRKPSDVALALLPAVGALMLLAVAMDVLNLSFNGLNLVAVPLIVGIGVDDGIFLTHIHRRARQGHLNRKAFIEQIAASTHAVVMTTFTTGLAFGSLALTRVPAIQQLGTLTAIGVFSALIVTAIGLIPILAALHRDRFDHQAESPD